MRQKTKIIAKQTKSQRIYTDTDTKELNQQKHQLTTISGEITREKQTKIKQTNSEMRQNRITQQEEHSKKECKKSARWVREEHEQEQEEVLYERSNTQRARNTMNEL